MFFFATKMSFDLAGFKIILNEISRYAWTKMSFEFRLPFDMARFKIILSEIYSARKEFSSLIQPINILEYIKHLNM